MIDLIGKACFNPVVNKGLTALNDANSNVKLVVNDMGTSSGRIYQEYERSPHGGRESFIEEVTTTGIWGAGIPLGKKAVDWMASKSSKNFLMPNLDLRLFNKDNAQRLDREVIDKYFQHPDQSKREAAETLLLQMEKEGGETVANAGKSLLNKNRMFQFAKVSGVGLTASVILGFGVPKLNQHITRMFVDREKAKKFEAAQSAQTMKAPQAPASNTFAVLPQAMNPFGNPMAANFGGQQFGVNAANPFVTLPNSPTGLTGIKNGVRFGSLGNMGSQMLQKLQENDQLGTLIFSDTPLSSGRVITARNTDERIEKAFKEAGIILTLFVIQQNLEARLAGSSNHLGYPALKALSRNFGSVGKCADYMAAYKNVQEQLKINGELGKYFESAKDKPELVKNQITQIRDYFNTKSTSQTYKESNLLLDMAEAGGKIPTLKDVVKDGRRHIDITREIDMDGIKSMAQYLDKLKLLAEQGDDAIRKQLSKTAAHKLGAFGGSMLVGSAIMSYAIPKIQHYITYKRTGKDYFPGVQLDDAPVVRPAAPMVAVH